MDVFTDDHEREEAVKKWWQDNWKAIVGGIVIALAGLVGYQQYKAYSLSQAQEKAYATYELKSVILAQDEGFESKAQEFMQKNPDLYGSLVALDLATTQIMGKEYDKASGNLDFAINNGGELVSDLSAMVKARLLASKGEHDAALATLNAIKSKSYEVEINELKGDILMQQGLRDEAYDAYKAAVEKARSKGLELSPILQIKYNNVIKSTDKPIYLEQAQ